MITPTQEHKFTSDKPYNRHKYKLTFVDGRSILFDDYNIFRMLWIDYMNPSNR